MEDMFLLKSACIVGCIGILIITYMSTLPATQEHAYVSIRGRIDGVYQSESITRAILTTECIIPVVVFDNITIPSSNIVRATGTYQLHDGKPEFIVESIAYDS